MCGSASTRVRVSSLVCPYLASISFCDRLTRTHAKFPIHVRGYLNQRRVADDVGNVCHQPPIKPCVSAVSFLWLRECDCVEITPTTLIDLGTC